MEQEVKVTIHGAESAGKAEEAQKQANIPEQLKDAGVIVSEALSCFRESDSYGWMLESTEKTRQYIKNNPARSMLVSLGAGLLFGLFITKRR